LSWYLQFLSHENLSATVQERSEYDLPSSPEVDAEATESSEDEVEPPGHKPEDSDVDAMELEGRPFRI
jgi:hypothetical protein